MKNLFRAGLFVGILSMAFITADAQRIYVGIRPSRPTVVVKRTVAPSPRHVWVDEEWVPQGNTYVWHGGYWAAPPRPHAVYVRGHWTHSRKGHIWIAGYWR
jgi:hypothetical protein